MNSFWPWNVYTNSNMIWCNSSIYVLKRNTMIGLYCLIQARRMEYSSEFKCRSFFNLCFMCFTWHFFSVGIFHCLQSRFLYTFDNQIIYMQNKEKQYLYKHVFILSI